MHCDFLRTWKTENADSVIVCFCVGDVSRPLLFFMFRKMRIVSFRCVALILSGKFQIAIEKVREFQAEKRSVRVLGQRTENQNDSTANVEGQNQGNRRDEANTKQIRIWPIAIALLRTILRRLDERNRLNSFSGLPDELRACWFAV
jgi:hypothetical protein